ncbi:MAG: NUDIX hydrolase [Candidatus Paceibacterota bacterium]
MFPPPGFACPAGHVDEGEDAKVAALREVFEETGIKIDDAEFLFEEEVPWNYCRSAGVHYWYVYKAEVSNMEINRQEEETKSAGWYTVEEMKNLPLEEVWKYFYEKLGII